MEQLLPFENEDFFVIFCKNKFHRFGSTIWLPNRKTFCDEIKFLGNRFGAAIYAPFNAILQGILTFWEINLRRL